MEYEISEDTEGLDLVALATITDIMPLLDENRILVHYGLKQLSENPRTGIKKLCEVSKVEPKDLDTYHLGFLLGPRINVSGRIGDPLKAVKLLISQDEDTCKEIAYELNGMNYQRQEMTKEALDRAEKEIDTENKVAIYFDKDIHEGIVGLVAGKLQEKYHIPTLVITELEGELRGSARSINGFNVTDALEEASKHLERFGGHAQAAGFSLKKENLEKFKKEMFKIAKRDITKEMLVPELRVDMVINPEDISYDLLNTLNKLKPYGYGNPKPNMMISNIQVKGKRVLGQSGSHMKIEMEKEDGSKLSMIMFNCDEDIEKISVGSKVDVVGSVYLNIWNGNESLEFQVKEWRFS
jgi:single-stranded-DNA-specific exonuclease